MPHRRLATFVLLALLALAPALTGCGSSSTATGSKGTSAKSSPKSPEFRAAGLLEPVRPAPALSLRNYLGQPVNIASDKGRAVLVTFIYTHCPDICPLITSNLRVALNLLPAAQRAKVAVIAVSVDPRGDTRKAIASFLSRHEMTGRMQYLVGSLHELAATWQAWGVGSEKDARNPEFIDHSGLVYGITASGKRLTIYAANFKPRDIAHDVPLLAAR
jgi:protein SCO1